MSNQEQIDKMKADYAKDLAIANEFFEGVVRARSSAAGLLQMIMEKENKIIPGTPIQTKPDGKGYVRRGTISGRAPLGMTDGVVEVAYWHYPFKKDGSVSDTPPVRATKGKWFLEDGTPVE